MSSYHEINAFMIKEAIDALLKGGRDLLDEVMEEDYPIEYNDLQVREYTVEEQLTQFLKDGFIDRYTGDKLFNPGILKVLSYYCPEHFPYDPGKKTIEKNGPYWMLTPAIDCVTPIPFGRDEKDNWATTSMIHHVIKGQYRLPMLGWDYQPKGNRLDWNGMTKEFIETVENDKSLLEDRFIHDWYDASIKLFMGGIYADGIIFEYQCLASYGGYGEDGGYGLTLRENGEFILSRYILGEEKPSNSEILICEKNIADDVKKEISDMHDELSTLPPTVDNQSCDGSADIFRFGKTKICGWNLRMYTLDELREMNPDGYEQYKDTQALENRVLSLYDRVAEIINRYYTGITLSLARKTRAAGLSNTMEEC